MHLPVCSLIKGADVRFLFVHEENVDEVRATWEVKRLVFGQWCIRRARICRTLDLITKKEESARELLACVNTPWTQHTDRSRHVLLTYRICMARAGL